MRNLLWLACLAFGFLGSAPRAVASDTRLLSPDEMTEWAAIGRLTFNRRDETRGFGCSATLIAPDLVLTAAHCLTYAYDLAPSKIRQLVFQAGWHTDQAIASVGAKRIAFHPDYKLGTGAEFQDLVPFDLALVTLSSPIEGIKPINVGELTNRFDLLSFVVYQGAITNAPRLTERCSHSRLNQRVLMIGCPVVGGNSGGGVLSGQSGARTLVAVLSASTGGRALAVFPDEWLIKEIAAHVGTN